MEDFRFQVNIGGIIDLLSQHLYSSPRVFIRELLQNAVDAVTERSLVDVAAPRSIEIQLFTGDVPEIRVTDSGSGLTLEQIHRFLSIIGESSKRGVESTDFIGRFGIGLLSAFLVSDTIVLETRSAAADTGYRWTGRQNGTYDIEPIERQEIGSSVVLKASEAGMAYFEPLVLESLLRYFGDILPYPVFFTSHATTPPSTVQINEMAPPWLTPAISDPRDIIEYGEEYFSESFMGYIPLKSRHGDVEGVAYILDRRVMPNAKSNHRVYLRNMLLSETGHGILPEWAFFLRAVVNAGKLRPTASREDFYEDELLETTREELGESIKAFLTEMAENNAPFMERFIHEHHLALKALAVEDVDILRTFANYFPFETSLGLYTLGELRSSGQLLRYTTKVDEFRQLAPMFGAMNQLLVNAGYVYDDELMSALADEFPDWEIELVTPEDALFVMDSLSFEERDYLFELEKVANASLERWGIEVDVKSFRPDELPGILLINEEASFLADLRYSKENSNEMFAELLSQFGKAEDSPRMVLCLNAANRLVKRLAANPEVGNSVYDLLYVQSLLLARRPLRREEMRALNSGILSLIERSI